MSVEIKREDERIIYVNDKMVRLDSDGNWIEVEELTPSESKAFHQYINSEKLSMQNRLN